LIKNSQPFVKKCQKTAVPGGFFEHLYSPRMVDRKAEQIVQCKNVTT